MIHTIFINAVSQERLEGIFSYSAQMFDQQFLISSSLNPISRGQELPFSVLYCSGTVGGIVTVLYIWSDNEWVKPWMATLMAICGVHILDFTITLQKLWTLKTVSVPATLSINFNYSCEQKLVTVCGRETNVRLYNEEEGDVYSNRFLMMMKRLQLTQTPSYLQSL